VQDVAKGIGLDGRIGRKFLHAGPGYGGSCFPKDCLALVKTARDAGAPISIVEAVIGVNDARKEAMAERVIHACGGNVSGKTLAVLGVTFKPNTDDMRDSPALDIIPALQKAGATVRAFDPEGMKEAAKLMDNVDFCTNAYETMHGADAVVLITEWNEFRALDLPKVKALLRTPTVIDLRNIYKPEDMSAAGFYYVSIGRPAVEPSATAERRQAMGTRS
jgi:UDPglucose 6-dehydrogenase